jgi:3',5'-cyclic-AMP phosphodiesterase
MGLGTQTPFRLAWLTDLHLNFLPYVQVDEFLGRVESLATDAILVTGDISEARELGRMLRHIAEHLQRPVYFVLGNHDFYHGSIREVRATATRACEEAGAAGRLRYLTAMPEPVELTPTVGLIGHDGWADARIGDYERSLVMMNDYRLIAELAAHGKRDRWPILQALGDEAAQHIRDVLPVALVRYQQVLLATHVPPLREACWHDGRPSDDEWAPHFTCKAMGDAILEIMRDFPQRQLTVFCGHTHSPGECRPLPNVQILTGGAKYGGPTVQRVLELQ